MHHTMPTSWSHSLSHCPHRTPLPQPTICLPPTYPGVLHPLHQLRVRHHHAHQVSRPRERRPCKRVGHLRPRPRPRGARRGAGRRRGTSRQARGWRSCRGRAGGRSGAAASTGAIREGWRRGASGRFSRGRGRGAGKVRGRTQRDRGAARARVGCGRCGRCGGCGGAAAGLLGGGG